MNEERNSDEKGLNHPFRPVIDARSRALVLGSFPSVKSRENAFYYGHPQNRFWRVLAALFAQEVPYSIDDKIAFLLERRIALWDVVSACDITGSADSALIPLRLNDIASLLRGTQIRRLFANGQKAGRLYREHLENQTGIPIQILPSTSPANAAWTPEKLITAWQPLRFAVSDGG
jgi:TDG/mug DNA glycosylase family protein